MTPLDLLILALATWRAAYFLTKEDGPLNFMVRFRSRTTLGGLLACLYCASAWCAALLFVVYATPAHVVVWILAISGGALMLARYTGVDYG